MIRFEILLPLFLNDGSPVPAEAFADTDDDLIHLFGATSTDTIQVSGHWTYESVKYEDRLIRVRVDVEDTEENWRHVRELKEALKVRFEQLDIWITASRIEVV